MNELFAKVFSDMANLERVNRAILGEKRWWVELLLDDGSEWGVPENAPEAGLAIIKAKEDAKRHGLRPVRAVSVTEQD